MTTQCPYQYLVFGKIICRYPASKDSITYSVIGDIASSLGWNRSAISMKLKMDEIYDAEFYTEAELVEYCNKHQIQLNI